MVRVVSCLTPLNESKGRIGGKKIWRGAVLMLDLNEHSNFEAFWSLIILERHAIVFKTKCVMASAIQIDYFLMGIPLLH